MAWIILPVCLWSSGRWDQASSCLSLFLSTTPWLSAFRWSRPVCIVTRPHSTLGLRHNALTCLPVGQHLILRRGFILMHVCIPSCSILCQTLKTALRLHYIVSANCTQESLGQFEPLCLMIWTNPSSYQRSQTVWVSWLQTWSQIQICCILHMWNTTYCQHCRETQHSC